MFETLQFIRDVSGLDVEIAEETAPDRCPPAEVERLGRASPLSLKKWKPVCAA
jgi:hypothetical protein